MKMKMKEPYKELQQYLSAQIAAAMGDEFSATKANLVSLGLALIKINGTALFQFGIGADDRGEVRYFTNRFCNSILDILQIIDPTVYADMLRRYRTEEEIADQQANSVCVEFDKSQRAKAEYKKQ